LARLRQEGYGAARTPCAFGTANPEHTSGLTLNQSDEKNGLFRYVFGLCRGLIWLSGLIYRLREPEVDGMDGLGLKFEISYFEGAGKLGSFLKTKPKGFYVSH
jgi:hypothetical protein